jgi:hypothetical protein
VSNNKCSFILAASEEARELAPAVGGVEVRARPNVIELKERSPAHDRERWIRIGQGLLQVAVAVRADPDPARAEFAQRASRGLLGAVRAIEEEFDVRLGR